ncbi:type II toxin-antitoxin system RelE family toxin [Streptomyces goshikiensis]|uniref:type II toxin-antitoxin system RelE family toxin n=1 Tax=Streptomyces goshikiensis TaxID=1942 RepID=UPI00369C94FE
MTPKAPVRTLQGPLQQRNAGFHAPPPSIPRPRPAPTGTPQKRCGARTQALRGVSGLYRLRVGSYRIAYRVLDGELVVPVVKVGDNRDVYRGV